jgi:hypothetical protein
MERATTKSRRVHMNLIGCKGTLLNRGTSDNLNVGLNVTRATISGKRSTTTKLELVGDKLVVTMDGESPGEFNVVNYASVDIDMSLLARQLQREMDGYIGTQSEIKEYESILKLVITNIQGG